MGQNRIAGLGRSLEPGRAATRPRAPFSFEAYPSEGFSV